MAGGSTKNKKEKKIYLVNGRGQLKPPFHLLSTAALAIHPWAERLHVGLQQNHDQHNHLDDDDDDGNNDHEMQQ